MVEFLCVIAIFAVLVGLLIPAVQNVRSAAARTKDANKLRQLSFATLQFADQHGGRLPSLWAGPQCVDRQAVHAIAPYLGMQFYPNYRFCDEFKDFFYQSESDPSFAELPARKGSCSFIGNGYVLTDTATLVANIPDGLSNTICWTETYARCHHVDFRHYMDGNCLNIYPSAQNGQTHILYDGDRKPAFADRQCGDVVAVTIGGISRALFINDQFRTATFQVSPLVSECDPSVPNSHHPNGLLVALLDGSVRTLPKATSEQAFWGLATPAARDIISAD
jgi:hypothetical protein